MTKEKLSFIKGHSLGASGFTIGIVSILTPGIIGIISSLLGFIFCFLQQKKKPTKLGKAGIILNVIGFAFSLVWILYLGPMYVQWLQKTYGGTFPTA